MRNQRLEDVGRMRFSSGKHLQIEVISASIDPEKALLTGEWRSVKLQ
jgi:hypothetical protein